MEVFKDAVIASTMLECPDSGARWGHTSTKVGDYIITFGGFQSNLTFLNDFIVLDTSDYTWETIKPQGAIPNPRRLHSACLYLDNKIVYFGGDDLSGVLSEVAILTVGLTRRKLFIDKIEGDFQLARVCHTAHIYEDNMYVFGGRDKMNKYFDQVWRLNLKTFRWIECQVNGSAPYGRDAHSSVLYGDKVYMFGGWSDKIANAMNDLWVFDLGKYEWKQITAKNFPPNARSKSVMFHADDKLYFFGGVSWRGENVNEFFSYDIENNQWESLQTRIPARSHATCVKLEDGIIIWGGKPSRFAESSAIFRVELKNSTELKKKNPQEIQSPILQNLYREKFYSDVVFVVEDKEILAHKCILAASCEYFKNILAKENTESQPLRITIKNVKKRNFEAMIEFIYCNDIKLDEELGLELLKLAEEYGLSSLKSKCGKFLCKNISNDKFVSIMKASDIFKMPDLLDEGLKYMIKNREEIEKRNDIYDLPQSILIEIIARLSMK